jgi:quinone-modifying oxidoreductase subunit QmoC
MGRLLSTPKNLPFVFGLPIILVLLGFWGKGFPEGEILFRNLIPYVAIDITAGLLVLVILISLVTGVRAFWQNLNKGPVGQTGSVPLVAAIKNVIVPVLRHERFNECDANKSRYLAHLFIFYGFVSCVIATGISGGLIWAEHFHLVSEAWLPPWSLMSVVKILGNLGGLAILTGCILVLYNRSANKENAGEATYADSVFTWVIVLTVVTGFLTQFVRWAELASLSYLVYAVHLVFVFYLLAYLPYSKFAHMVYRTVALIYAETIGRRQR